MNTTPAIKYENRIELFYTTADVARKAGISLRQVQRIASSGLLSVILVGKDRGPRGGRMRLFSRVEVDQFISERNKSGAD